MQLLTNKLIRSLVQPRAADSHKGNHGHALLIAGSKGKMGAAVISSRACLRAGAGLLSVLVPAKQGAIIQTAVPEAMLCAEEKEGMDLSAYSGIGIGPGLGKSKESLKVVTAIIERSPVPLVIDADALNIISLHKTLFLKLQAETILTPHPKEFDRLFGAHSTEEERIKTAVKKSKEYNIIIVLKGHKTVIIQHDKLYKNTTGNAGLAKGGSGDALTGIITSFLAQGYTPFAAANLGVYIHGLAADISLKTQSAESMLISDVIENLGQAFKLINKD